ncbi:ATP-dependent DNA helicase PcrA [bacterium BMS3Bbin06]|nr:ATP-dependent DNA helicase PcrA [bacterium BMS3Abin08]GBE35044.1 ATP-dependent DNA helicase PcrA [bacterium BMS3Bbin06]HDO35110.1 ATP-dependent DNA helicase PcrA [Nitrospirota bacterium]HDY70333.1 ATP-dependent DNA helicase PcrA [Nitrospirota bacterium]
MGIDELLIGLNPQQREALLYTDGPLMVLAGAGSGKTKLITHKYAYLNRKHKVSPSSIFTVTFTNKAATEMRNRISSFLSNDLQNCWIGTFHAQCNRILRKEIKALGYSPGFVIYDQYDQYNLIRHILKELKIYEALYKGVASRIGSLKASLVTPEDFVSAGDGFGFDEKLAKVYVRYQDELKRCNALDFDDLIMLTVRLFREFPDILRNYSRKFRHVLVDEFQDTNLAQYELVKLLCSDSEGISVVGDDDQSIYRFRGAEVKNIFKFEKDFPGLKIIKLEQNYRSTRNILHVSSSVISRNSLRKEKQLWTDKSEGEKVHFHWLPDEEDEAKYISKALKEIYLKGVFGYGDMAILYRINLQSRALEDALRRERIPYSIIGGMSFYERREIKDIISYLKLTLNPHDNVSLRRIINTPPRGIGAATLNKIEQESRKDGVSLFDSIKRICRARSSSQMVFERLNGLVEMLERLSGVKKMKASEAIKMIVDVTGYADGLEEDRIQNIAEFMVSSKADSVGDFLDRVSLYTRMDEAHSTDSVSLMTLHTAKGLEFPVVFIVGLEEGLLPYFKSLENEDELCEERRIFYVGMTRAKDVLCMTGAQKRRVFSKLQDQEPSRFLSDIPRDCCQWIEKVRCATPRDLPRKKGNGRAVAYALPSYKTGCRVRHPKWGVGVVRDCYGEGDDMKVCVNFPGVGMKRLALKFAQLERI